MQEASSATPDTINRLLQIGNAGGAMQHLREALAVQPDSADLHLQAGLCAVKLGDDGEAEALWRRAMLLDPSLAEAQFNLGILLERAGRLAEAEALYRQALALSPTALEVRLNLANLLMATNKLGEAAQHYQATIALQPAYIDAHYNLALLHYEARQFAAAADGFASVLALDPDNADAHAWLGLLHAARRDWALAQQHYVQALRLQPGHVDAWCNLGLLLGELRQWDEAERCLRHALSLSPQRPKLHANLGSLLLDRGEMAEAEQAIARAIELAPESAQAWSNMGVLLSNTERELEAESCFRHAISLSPASAMPRFNLAQLLLMLGRYEEGWQHYEARFDPELESQATEIPTLPMPRWHGEALRGKSLLVWTEQGYGDVIQFCRYLARLKAQGARYITLVCQPALLPLLQSLDGADAVLALDDDTTEVPGHDYWTFLLSLPHWLRSALDRLPADIPYLHCPAEAQQRWAGALPAPGLRVGLVWRGNPHHLNDAERSLPSLSELAPLWDVPGLSFFSLQTGEQADVELAGQPMIKLGHQLHDFADTAAVLAQLDLLISVDTAVAHLAGAMGRPCWVLLPAYKTDWRWLRQRADSPWYPGMRLFRQVQRQDWSTPVLQLRDSLLAWAMRA
ncbi:tetratricopeptide repeat protein [Chitinimonas sp.]|uniref:tetratricopeptide repeat protein n=1 Tax=Chitinimonas sp. TaxID=1934313 RepID=UPI0035B2A1A2